MLRAGIIGCGGITERRHGPVLATLKDRVHIAALADLAPQRTALMGENLGVDPAHQYQDYEEMLRREALDFVHICTPHHLHEPQAVAALQAGAHVLLEKPLCTTLPEADRMIAVAAAADRKITVSHNQLFAAEHRAVMDQLRNDAIGRVFLIRSEGVSQHHVQGRGVDQHWRGQSTAGGGGPLIDNGFHRIYRALDYAGARAVRAYAQIGRHVQDIEVEDMALVLIEHENGATTSVQVGWCSWGGGVGVNEIYGTKGQIRLGGQDGTSLSRKDAEAWESIAVEEEEADRLGFPTVVQNFVAAIETGGEVPVRAEDSRHVLAIVLAAYESGRSGRAVDIEVADVATGS